MRDIELVDDRYRGYSGAWQAEMRGMAEMVVVDGYAEDMYDKQRMVEKGGR